MYPAPIAAFMRSIPGRWLLTFSPYFLALFALGLVLHARFAFAWSDLAFYLLTLTLLQLSSAALFVQPIVDKMRRRYAARKAALDASRCDSAEQQVKEKQAAEEKLQQLKTKEVQIQCTVKLPPLALLNPKHSASAAHAALSGNAAGPPLETGELHLDSRLIARALEAIPYQFVHPYVNENALGIPKDKDRPSSGTEDWFESARFSLALLTLVPFRLLVTFFTFFSCYFHARLTVLGLGTYDPKTDAQPFSPWRSRFAWIAAPLCRWAMFCWGVVWIKRKGVIPSSSKQAPILVYNHCAYIDSFFSLIDCCPSPVGAAEYLNVPLIGSLVRLLQFLPVVRTDSSSKRDVIHAVAQRCAQMTHPSSPVAWPPILTYPEGTCSSGRVLGGFKVGAFLPGVPVQPITISYENPAYEPGERNQIFYPAWVNFNLPVVWNMLSFLAEPLHYVSLTYLPLHEPTAQEKRDPTVFANNVKREMSVALAQQMGGVGKDGAGVPMTEHSFEDVGLQQMVSRTPAQTPDSTVLTVGEFRSFFPAAGSMEHLRWMLFEFLSIDEKQRRGRLDFLQVRDWMRGKIVAGEGKRAAGAEGEAITDEQIRSIFLALRPHLGGGVQKKKGGGHGHSHGGGHGHGSGEEEAKHNLGPEEENIDFRQFCILSALLIPHSTVKPERPTVTEARAHPQ